MTREEAVAVLNMVEAHGSLVVKAKDMAIKALEQEPILDKIRAEILDEAISHIGTGEEVIQAYVDGLNRALKIIDKYKAESENKE